MPASDTSRLRTATDSPSCWTSTDGAPLVLSQVIVVSGQKAGANAATNLAT